MLFKNKISQLEKALKQRNFSHFISIGLLLLVLMQQLYINLRSETIVLVPPVIEKPFRVSYKDVSASYLEAMAHFFLSLLLDVSSSTVDRKHNLLIGYIDAKNHDYYLKSWAESDAKFKGKRIATNFIPHVMKVDTEKLQVIASGSLITYMGGKRIESKGKTFKIQLNYQGGWLLIKSFEEVSENV